MNYADLVELVASRNVAAVTATSNLEPVDGPGSPICPPTFAPAKDKRIFAGGVILTKDTVQRVFDPKTGQTAVVRDENDRLIIGNSVVVDSVGSQATRAENALWELRDELDLSGIVADMPDEGDIAEAVDKAIATAGKTYKDLGRFSTEVIRDTIISEFRRAVPEISSWTLPHRHIDGVIRMGSQYGVSNSDGASPLYQRLSAAGPGNIGDLLKLSPNSVLNGYWASIGMPVGHKVARSFSQHATGYGAQLSKAGGTKASVMASSSEVALNSEGDLMFKQGELSDADQKKGFKRPSQLGLGNVPSLRENVVTCSSIIGTGSISLAQLRQIVGRDKHLNQEQKQAATVALVALGVLGRVLVLEDGFYRSGCALVDTDTVWTVVRRGQAAQQIDLPVHFDGAVELAKQAFADAVALGAWGTAADRQVIDLGKHFINTVASSYVVQMAKGAESAEEGN